MKLRVEFVEETIDNYLKIEKESLEKLLNGEYDKIDVDDKIFLRTAIKNTIDVLENIKYDLLE